MPSPQNNSSYFHQNTDGNGFPSSLEAASQSFLSKLGTPLLVKVEAVHPGEASITGMVDVQPMVHQQDATGRAYPRQVIHNVPYLRIQGGTSALIIDPKPGDIGFIIISGRDHTHAVTTRQPSPPASFRQFALQDCVYVGGFLNNGPNQFIQATEQGWRIVTPGIVSIEATKITANCDIETSGDVKAGGISLKQHTHGGVQPGSGDTGQPK